MPRAASLSVHARVEGTRADVWAAPPLVQIWGPRYSAFAVADDDVATFTLGRLPDAPKARRRAEETADRLEAALGGDRVDCREVARDLGLHPNALRYAAPTGRFLIRWDGARQPHVWAVPVPDVDPHDARHELVRRYLHVFGPGSVDGFAQWAGVTRTHAAASFDDLAAELGSVQTPVGEATILAADAGSFEVEPAVATRLLPSGDTYYLLHGVDRELLVPETGWRERLWTSRVWPGAVLHEGEIVGTWRRSGHVVTVAPLARPVERRDRTSRPGGGVAPTPRPRPTTTTRTHTRQVKAAIREVGSTYSSILVTRP